MMRPFGFTLTVGLLCGLAFAPMAAATEIDVQLDEILIEGGFETTQTYVPDFPILGMGELDLDAGTGTIDLSDYMNFIDLAFNGVGNEARIDLMDWQQTITAIDVDGNITSTGSGSTACESFTGIGETLCGSVPPTIEGWPPPDGEALLSSAVIDTEAQTIVVIDNSVALAGTITSSYSYTVVPEPEAGLLGMAGLITLAALVARRSPGRARTAR